MEQLIKELQQLIKSSVEEAVDRKITETLPNVLRLSRLPLLLDSDQAMRELNLKSRHKLLQLRRRGEIEYIKEGRSVRYVTESVLNYINNNTIKGAKP